MIEPRNKRNNNIGGKGEVLFFASMRKKIWMRSTSAIIALVFLFNIVSTPAYGWRPGNYGERSSLEAFGGGLLVGGITSFFCLVSPTSAPAIAISNIASDVTSAYIYYNDYKNYNKPSFTIDFKLFVFWGPRIKKTFTRGEAISMAAGIIAGAVAGMVQGVIENALEDTAKEAGEEAVKDTAQTAIQTTTQTVVANTTRSFFATILNALGNAATWVWKNLIVASLKNLKDLIVKPIETLVNIAKGIVNLAKRLCQKIKTLSLRNLLRKLKELAFSPIRGARNIAKGIVNLVKGIGRKIKSVFKTKRAAEDAIKTGKKLTEKTAETGAKVAEETAKSGVITHGPVKFLQKVGRKLGISTQNPSPYVTYGRMGLRGIPLFFLQLGADFARVVFKRTLREYMEDKFKEMGLDDGIAEVSAEAFMQAVGNAYVDAVVLTTFATPFDLTVTNNGGFATKAQMEAANARDALGNKRLEGVYDENGNELTVAEAASAKVIITQDGRILDPQTVKRIELVDGKPKAVVLKNGQKEYVDLTMANFQNVIASGREDSVVALIVGEGKDARVARIDSISARSQMTSAVQKYVEYITSPTNVYAWKDIHGNNISDNTAIAAGFRAIQNQGLGSIIAGLTKVLALKLLKYTKYGSKRVARAWKMALAQAVGNITGAAIDNIDTLGWEYAGRPQEGNPYATGSPQLSYTERMNKIIAHEIGTTADRIAWAKISDETGLDGAAGELVHIAFSNMASSVIDATLRRDPGIAKEEVAKRVTDGEELTSTEIAARHSDDIAVQIDEDGKSYVQFIKNPTEVSADDLFIEQDGKIMSFEEFQKEHPGTYELAFDKNSNKRFVVGKDKDGKLRYFPVAEGEFLLLTTQATQEDGSKKLLPQKILTATQVQEISSGGSFEVISKQVDGKDRYVMLGKDKEGNPLEIVILNPAFAAQKIKTNEKGIFQSMVDNEKKMTLSLEQIAQGSKEGKMYLVFDKNVKEYYLVVAPEDPKEEELQLYRLNESKTTGIYQLVEKEVTTPAQELDDMYYNGKLSLNRESAVRFIKTTVENFNNDVVMAFWSAHPFLPINTPPYAQRNINVAAHAAKQEEMIQRIEAGAKGAYPIQAHEMVVTPYFNSPANQRLARSVEGAVNIHLPGLKVPVEQRSYASFIPSDERLAYKLRRLEGEKQQLLKALQKAKEDDKLDTLEGLIKQRRELLNKISPDSDIAVVLYRLARLNTEEAKLENMANKLNQRVKNASGETKETELAKATYDLLSVQQRITQIQKEKAELNEILQVSGQRSQSVDRQTVNRLVELDRQIYNQAATLPQLVMSEIVKVSGQPRIGGSREEIANVVANNLQDALVSLGTQIAVKEAEIQDVGSRLNAGGLKYVPGIGGLATAFVGSRDGYTNPTEFITGGTVDYTVDRRIGRSASISEYTKKAVISFIESNPDEVSPIEFVETAKYGLSKGREYGITSVYNPSIAGVAMPTEVYGNKQIMMLRGNLAALSAELGEYFRAGQLIRDIEDFPEGDVKEYLKLKMKDSLSAQDQQRMTSLETSLTESKEINIAKAFIRDVEAIKQKREEKPYMKMWTYLPGEDPEKKKNVETAIQEILIEGRAVYHPEYALMSNTTRDQWGRPIETTYYDQVYDTQRGWQNQKMDRSTKYYSNHFGVALVEDRDYTYIHLPEEWTTEEREIVVEPEGIEVIEKGKPERVISKVVKPAQPERVVVTERKVPRNLISDFIITSTTARDKTGAMAYRKIAEFDTEQQKEEILAKLGYDPERGVLVDKDGFMVGEVDIRGNEIYVNDKAPSRTYGPKGATQEGLFGDYYETIREETITPATPAIVKKKTIPAVPPKTKPKPAVKEKLVMKSAYTVGPNVTYDVNVYTTGEGHSPWVGPSNRIVSRQINSGPMRTQAAHYALVPKVIHHQFNEAVITLGLMRLTGEKDVAKEEEALRTLSELGIPKELALERLDKLSWESFENSVRVQELKKETADSKPHLITKEEIIKDPQKYKNYITKWAIDGFMTPQIAANLAFREDQTRAQLTSDMASVQDMQFYKYEKVSSGRTYALPTWSLKAGYDYDGSSRFDRVQAYSYNKDTITTMLKTAHTKAKKEGNIPYQKLVEGAGIYNIEGTDIHMTTEGPTDSDLDAIYAYKTKLDLPLAADIEPLRDIGVTPVIPFTDRIRGDIKLRPIKTGITSYYKIIPTVEKTRESSSESSQKEIQEVQQESSFDNLSPADNTDILDGIPASNPPTFTPGAELKARVKSKERKPELEVQLESERSQDNTLRDIIDDIISSKDAQPQDVSGVYIRERKSVREKPKSSSRRAISTSSIETQKSEEKTPIGLSSKLSLKGNPEKTQLPPTLDVKALIRTLPTATDKIRVVQDEMDKVDLRRVFQKAIVSFCDIPRDIVPSPEAEQMHIADSIEVVNIDGKLGYVETRYDSNKDELEFTNVYTYDGKLLGPYEELEDKIQWHPFVANIEKVQPSPEFKRMLADNRLVINYLYGQDTAQEGALHNDFIIPKEKLDQLKAQGATGFDLPTFYMRYNGQLVKIKLHIALTFSDWWQHSSDPQGKYGTDWSHIDSHGRFGFGPQGIFDESPAGVTYAGYTETIPKSYFFGEPQNSKDSYNYLGTFADTGLFQYKINPDSSVVVTARKDFAERWGNTGSNVAKQGGYQLLTLGACKSDRFWQPLASSSSKQIDALVTKNDAIGNSFFEIYAGLLTGQSLEQITQGLNKFERLIDGQSISEWMLYSNYKNLYTQVKQ
jgi:hypothetical protein